MPGKHSVIKKSISHFWIILCFLAVFIAVYAPVVQTGYFYLDDYVYFEPHERSLDLFMKEAVNEGRVLEGPLLYKLSTFIKSSESTKRVRLIGIVGIALLASVMYAVFKRSRYRSDHAFLMSASICTLQFIQIFVSWMIIIPSIYSALLSSFSALLLFNVLSENDEKPKNQSIVFLTAVVLLVTALSINQPPAMFYWVMGLVFFLSGDNCDLSKKERRQSVIRYFIVGLISIVIYYVIFIKLVPFIMNTSLHRDNVIPLKRIPLRLIWFFKGPLVRTMNLWNADPAFIFAAFIGLIIFIGIILNSLLEIKGRKQFSAINFLTKCFLIASLVFLCFLPKLMVRDNSLVDPYWLRTLIALGPAVSVLFFWGSINIVEFFKYSPEFSSGKRKTVITVLLALLTVVTSFSAHNNVKKFITRFSTELNYIEDTIRDYGVSNLLKDRKIYIRRSRPWPLSEKDPFNEFKAASATSAEQGLIGSVIKWALYDVGVREDIQCTTGAYDTPVPEDRNTLIIDLMAVDKFNRIYEEIN